VPVVGAGLTEKDSAARSRLLWPAQDFAGFLSILGPNQEAHAAHPEVRPHAACIIGGHHRFDLGGLQSTPRYFSVDLAQERADDYQFTLSQGISFEWAAFLSLPYVAAD
jgi:hypothetical protein